MREINSSLIVSSISKKDFTAESNPPSFTTMFGQGFDFPLLHKSLTSKVLYSKMHPTVNV